MKRIATRNQIEAVQLFFKENLGARNSAVYNEEFTCPFGVAASIMKKQVVLIENQSHIIAAARFYPRKRDGKISLYQFAVHRDFRNRKIMSHLLEFFKDSVVEVQCPDSSDLNLYYSKTGWRLIGKDKDRNIWELCL